ncbi:MAG: DUF1801 domain-containing protein [Myxococcaceae bacterium]
MPKTKRAKKPAKRAKSRSSGRVAKPSRASRHLAPRLSPLSGESVDSFVKTLPSPQQMIVNRLRALVAQAAPEAMEALKFAQPVFEAEGPFAHIKPSATQVHFGFLRGALLEAPDGVLSGDGEMMRYVSISAWREVKEDILKGLVRQAVLLNQRLGDPTKR